MIPFEVYITFVFVVVFASLVVISKIVIYDWWIKEKVLCMYTTQHCIILKIAHLNVKIN